MSRVGAGRVAPLVRGIGFMCLVAFASLAVAITCRAGVAAVVPAFLSAHVRAARKRSSTRQRLRMHRRMVARHTSHANALEDQALVRVHLAELRHHVAVALAILQRV